MKRIHQGEAIAPASDTYFLVVPILVFFGRHQILDDAQIWSHYIQNALDGLGLVFNAGEHVNALTSPLYSYLLLLLAALLHGHVWLAGMIYGSFLPTSSSAKVGQGRSGYWGAWPMAFLGLHQLWIIIKNEFRYNPFSFVFLIVAAPIDVKKLRSLEWVRISLGFAALLLFFYVAFNLPNYHWYYAPFVCLLTLFAVAAIPHTELAVASLWGLAVLQTVACIFAIRSPRERIKNYDAIAHWIDQRSPPNASIAAAEIGELACTSHRRIIDIIGLTEPKNAVHVAHRDVSSWIEEARPDFIIVHQPAWSFEQSAVKNPNCFLEPFHSGDVYILKRKPEAP